MSGCFSPLATIDGSMGGPAPIGIECVMRSGSSGGGWLIDDDRYLASVMSYFYTGGTGGFVRATFHDPRDQAVALGRARLMGADWLARVSFRGRSCTDGVRV